ncbi:MAG: J domain-containing protein [Pseudomonadota bacterium]|nr:J domain-containing protein [Pseudomonadota bacterium]
MPRIHTYYDNLKVPRTATPEAIRAAYRRLSQKHHPDRNPDNPAAARVMVLLNVAYQVLSDPAKRAEHDCWIRQQEDLYEPFQSSFPPRPEPAAPDYRSRTSRPPPRRKEPPDITGRLREVVRGAFVFLGVMVIGVPLLASITALWEVPAWPTAQQTAHRHATKPTSEAFTKPLVQIQSRDPSGTYRLVKSDYKLDDGESIVHSKGKLVIRKLRKDTYILLEAKTFRAAGTQGDADIYHVQPGKFGFDKVELRNNKQKWALLDGDQLVKRITGANFEETTWWQRVPEGYSEKYLDRGIHEAERVYKLRLARGGADE